MAHDYLRRLEELATDGREVIHYDQVGCGRSTYPAGVPASHWSVGLFVGELAGLLDHWGIDGPFHLLGQSWGGMLASEYVLAHPDQVASLALLNSPASMPAWAEGTRALVAELPDEVQSAIAEHESAGTYEAPEYLAAVDAFYGRHLCRLAPWPQDLRDSLAWVGQDSTVYSTMIGPSEFTITGTLADWTVVDRLSRIEQPTLVGYGEHDEATDSWRPFSELIPDAEVHEFTGASHTPHLETTDEFDRVVGQFLRAHDDGRLEGARRR